MEVMRKNQKASFSDRHMARSFICHSPDFDKVIVFFSDRDAQNAPGNICSQFNSRIVSVNNIKQYNLSKISFIIKTENYSG